MRKILILIFTLLLIMCCGCDNTKSVSNTDVEINMPIDDTVNGYRDETDTGNTTSTTSKEESTNNKGSINNSSKSETTDTTENTTTQYCANTNSKKFHFKSCVYAEKTNPENRLYLSNRDELISLGYIPCQKCKP